MQILALALLCQWLEPVPPAGEVGQPVQVTVWSAESEPVPGVVVRARRPGGEIMPLGTTDQRGSVPFAPETPGSYELRAQLPGRELVLVTPFQARSPSRRWLYILLCVPAGVFLLRWNLRRARDARPAPSR